MRAKRQGLAETRETEPRLCLRSDCEDAALADAPWCERHGPRFDVRPIARASYSELAHATYAGESIAAQAADTRTERERKAAAARMRRLARRGRCG